MKIISLPGVISMLTISCLCAGIVGQTSSYELSMFESETEIEEDTQNTQHGNEQDLQAQLSKQVLANSIQIDTVEKKLTLLIDALDQFVFVEEKRQDIVAEPDAIEEEYTLDDTMVAPVEDMHYVDHFANYLESEEIEVDDKQQSAIKIEQGFEAALSTRQITGVTLVHTECKATLCKFELGFEDEAASEKYSNIGISIAPWDSQTFFHQSEIDPQHTIYYVAKAGFDLPMPESSPE